MKRIVLLSALVVCLVFGATAQEKGQIRLTAGLALGTKAGVDESGEKAGVGINFGGEYFVSDVISIAPSYTTFFKSDISGTNVSLKLSAFNIDGRYYFTTDGPQIYGLLGLSFLTGKAEADFLGTSISVKTSDTGLNIGAGAVFPLSDKLGINLQAKYQTPGEGQMVINGGLILSL